MLAATMLFAVLPAFAATEADPDVYPLYADQNVLVGYIEVWDDGDNLYVNYVITEDGWYITETHVHVGAELSDFPLNRGGNPQIGNFDYGEPVDWKTEFLVTIPIDPAWGTTFKIAAHAVVETKDECIPGATHSDTYLSDITTMVIKGNVPDAVYPHPAVLANPGPHYNINTWTNATNAQFGEPYPAWIWESMPVVNPILGDIVWFEKTFDVIGEPTAGSLKIAVDNGYAVWLNGSFLGSLNLYDFVGGDFTGLNFDTFEDQLGDLKMAYVNTTNWQTVVTFDLTPYLVEGSNVLTIMAVNEYMNPDDGPGTQPIGGPTPLYNPGGMAFSFIVDSLEADVCIPGESETAWAALAPGVNRFTGQGNWATYVCYTLEPTP